MAKAVMDDEIKRGKEGAGKASAAQRNAGLPPLEILLVEDNPVNQTVVLMILKREGHRVTTVGDGQQALDILCTQRFDVVLMDIRMPGMNGDEATRRIRTQESGVLDCDIPIIAMTAYSTSEDVERFLGAGMDAFVGKPMTWETVTQTIRDTLRGKGRLE
jgi:CheY-like chemotaxis protein